MMDERRSPRRNSFAEASFEGFLKASCMGTEVARVGVDKVIIFDRPSFTPARNRIEALRDWPLNNPSRSLFFLFAGGPMEYRCEATSVAGFIQQLAVAYVGRGYFFYVAGVIP
jgi:hypothetical protein